MIRTGHCPREVTAVIKPFDVRSSTSSSTSVTVLNSKKGKERRERGRGDKRRQRKQGQKKTGRKRKKNIGADERGVVETTRLSGIIRGRTTESSALGIWSKLVITDVHASQSREIVCTVSLVVTCRNSCNSFRSVRGGKLISRSVQRKRRTAPRSRKSRWKSFQGRSRA